MLAVIAAVTLPALADEDWYCDNEGVETRNVVPLEQLFVRIREEFEGRILKVELENEEDDDCTGWIYEVKLLTPDGYVLKLEYNPETLELLKARGRYRKKHEYDDDD